MAMITDSGRMNDSNSTPISRKTKVTDSRRANCREASVSSMRS